jgi:rod shape-determining protein MreD
MKAGFALLALGIVALLVQGSIATFLPPPYCPDLAFLVVLCIGLVWDHPVAGLVVAALLGYSADLLSSSLLGQHAFLRLFVFVGARVASRRLNIRGNLPLACFAAGFTVVYGFSLLTVTDFFTSASGWSWSLVADLLRHALVNGLCVSLVLGGVRRLLGWLDEAETSRRPMRLEPRQRTV